MAAAAELLDRAYEQPVLALDVEGYGRSLRQLRTMGRFIVDNVVTNEAVGIKNEAYMDFNRAAGENLATDEEFGELLAFDPLETFDIKNGRVVDKAGKPVAEMVKQGWLKSKKEAETNPEMLVQAERDEGDVMIAHIVDNLEVNEMYMIVSVEPKDELKRNPDFWHEQMHYIDGMAVVQVYYRKNNNEMLAGCYSLKGSNLDSLRHIYKELGVTIPEAESPNRWSRYGVRRRVTEDEAAMAGPNLVKRHRLENRQQSPVYSVTELVANHQQEVSSYFNTYIVPLTEALVTKNNNHTMQSFAQSLLSNVNKLSAREKHRLMCIASSEKFTEDDAIFMEEKVRYALIEELRKPLANAIRSGVVQEKLDSIGYRQEMPVFVTGPVQPFMLAVMNQRASRNVSSGSDAGRSYGGCSGAGKSIDNYDNELNDLPDSQKIWSGNLEDSLSKKVEKDENGPLEFKCTKGHVNKREKDGWVYECQTCGEDVSCGRKQPDKSSQNSKETVLFAKKSKKVVKKWAA